jgi:hypothetical protein
MRSLSDPAGDLEVEKAGVGSAGFDQLTATELEIRGRLNIDAAETRAQAIQVGLEMEDPAAEHLDPFVERVTKEQAAVLWIDASLCQRQYATVEATERFHAARPTSNSSKKLSRARKKLSTSGS